MPAPLPNRVEFPVNVELLIASVPAFEMPPPLLQTPFATVSPSSESDAPEATLKTCTALPPLTVSVLAPGPVTARPAGSVTIGRLDTSVIVPLTPLLNLIVAH